MNITVVYESWRPLPLAWIHRAEARSVGEELRRVGRDVRLERYRHGSVIDSSATTLLLRLSDPMMLIAVQTLTSAGLSFIGPSAEVMLRCYDKYEAYRIATANGVDCPVTAFASDAAELRFPLILKPRRGSDSIGVRLFKCGPISARLRSESYIVQQQVRGTELTVAVFRDQVGTPLRIHLPEGTLYSFPRKFLLRPPRSALSDKRLAERVRESARQIADIFEVNWAARIDMIYETGTDRLRFLECDVAPLIGPQSAFAASFEAAGISRAEQLRMLLNEAAHRTDARA